MQPLPWSVKVVRDEPIRHPWREPDALGMVDDQLIYVVKVYVVDAQGQPVEGMGYWANSQTHPIKDREVDIHLAVQATRFAVDTINSLAAKLEGTP